MHPIENACTTSFTSLQPFLNLRSAAAVLESRNSARVRYYFLSSTGGSSEHRCRMRTYGRLAHTHTRTHAQVEHTNTQRIFFKKAIPS